MAKVDVRTTLDVTAIQFADNLELRGDAVSPNITANRISDGTQMMSVPKVMVDDLIRALELTKKFW